MKAFETSERYAGKVRECCNYAARSAKTFISDDKPKRQPCGEDEKRLSDTLKEDLAKFCDTVSEDSFPAKQKTYIVSNLLTFICLLLAGACAILGYFFSELIIIGTIIFALLALLATCGAFGGTEKRVTGTNVLAIRNCKSEVKNRVIIEANLDAPFKRKTTPKTARLLRAANIIFIILDIAFAVFALLVTYQGIKFFAADEILYIGFALPLFSIPAIVLSRSVIPTASTYGVADNLIGCYTACGTLRYLSEMDLRLEHTEIGVLLTSAKNAKHAGAKMYCKMHGENDKSLGTTIISLDTIYNPSTLSLLYGNKKTTELLETAAKTAETSLIESNPKYLKGSSKIFKKAGINSITVTSLANEIPDFYGTAADNADNINVKAIEDTMKLLLETAYLMDAQ